jgi:hypothetical protein
MKTANAGQQPMMIADGFVSDGTNQNMGIPGEYLSSTRVSSKKAAISVRVQWFCHVHLRPIVQLVVWQKQCKESHYQRGQIFPLSDF